MPQILQFQLFGGRMLLSMKLFILNWRKFFFSFYLGRKEGRERETSTWKRNIDWLPSIWGRTGDQTCNLALCPDWELNPEAFSDGMMLQPSEPHQPGKSMELFKYVLWDLRKHSKMSILNRQILSISLKFLWLTYRDFTLITRQMLNGHIKTVSICSEKQYGQSVFIFEKPRWNTHKTLRIYVHIRTYQI